MTEEQEKLLDSSVELGKLGKLANQAYLYSELLDGLYVTIKNDDPTGVPSLVKLLPKLTEALSDHSKELYRLSDATCPED